MPIEVEFFGVPEIGAGRQRFVVDIEHVVSVTTVLEAALQQVKASISPESLLERYLILVDGDHTIYGKGLGTDVCPGQKITIVAQFAGG